MHAQRNKKIDLVLIEENLQRRNNISSRLRTQGFSVDAPSGGFHAIKVLDENEVKATILCSDMDDMSIEEMATLIRSMSGCQKEMRLFLFVEQAQRSKYLPIFNEMKFNALISQDNFSQLAEALKKIV